MRNFARKPIPFVLCVADFGRFGISNAIGLTFSRIESKACSVSRRGKRLITTESREEAAEDIMSFFGNSADDTAENSSDDNA